MKFLVCFFCLFALAPRVLGNPLTGEGVLFYDRGHYWIELTFYDSEAEDILLPSPRAGDFTIVDERGDQGAFDPSRVDVFNFSDKRVVVLLTSGRFRGDKCYRVEYEPVDGSPVVIESICDPFYSGDDGSECAPKRIFRRCIAPAFSRSGDIYNLNQFRYEYDYSDERANSNLVIQPFFKVAGLTLEPYFEQDRVAYDLGGPGKTSTRKRSFGVAVSRSAWVKDVRVSFTADYGHERSSFSVNGTDSVAFSHALRVEGRVRLDNFFDSINRHCLSVFKGVDLGFGYAWYRSAGREIWDDSRFERTTPFFDARFTWTLFYGFQFSYSIESYWPASLGERFEEFHSFRARLLLRDVLARPSSRHYHPDLEFALDSGRRLPLFEKEEKVSLGFTFDLFPW